VATDDQLAPDVVPLFRTHMSHRNLMWLAIFFSTSEASQPQVTLPRAHPARTADRDLPVSEATVAAHLAAAYEWGAAARQLHYLKGIPHPALVVNAATTSLLPP